MSDTNEREFEAWAISQHAKGYQENLTWNCWQAATSASDARYQARIIELEEALRLLLKNARAYGEAFARYQVAYYERIAVDSKHTRAKLLGIMEDRLIAVPQALSTTPDTALQRKVLEDRIDELVNVRPRYSLDRELELRAQLAALNSNETLGE